jgi:D-aminopeptidase
VRARDLGVVIGTGTPGPRNAITDVAGVLVGHVTLIAGHGRLVRGRGPIRTGVTVVLPHEEVGHRRQFFAGCHTLNGNGEMTGSHLVRELGTLSSPIALTNTHSVGVVRDALVAREVDRRNDQDLFWSLPVVAETWDGVLNDCNGFHVRAEHVREALDDASARSSGQPVPEGNVGGGTGMICHGFKGGIGTASRVTETANQHTVGVLVQANHGARRRLAVNGAPVGALLDAAAVPLPTIPGAAPVIEGSGSVIVLVATDAHLLPHQCRRLAQRAGLGVARTGGAGEHSSGDLFLAFATGNEVDGGGDDVASAQEQPLRMLFDAAIDPLFHAVVEATEEAVLNALVAADTMAGRDDATAHALPHDRLVEVLDRYGLRRGV